MQTCSRCGNKIRDKAKYCDNCNSYLKLNNLEIQFNPKKYEKIRLLEKAIKEASNLIEEDIYGNLSAKTQIQIIYDTIYSYLVETTNLLKVLKKYGLNEKYFFYHSLELINRVSKYPDGIISNEFLFEINQIFSDLKNKNNNVGKYLFYTNIKSREYIENTLLEILEYFNFKVFSYDDFKFPQEFPEDFRTKFRSKYLILEYNSAENHISNKEEKALNQLYLLFGYLTFIHRFGRLNRKWHVNRFTLNHQISDLNASAMIELDKNNNFIDIHESLDILTTKIKIEKSDLIKFTNIHFKTNLYESIKNDVKNELVLHNIEEYLRLYYIASTKSDLENSFIKFWTLAEKILKATFGQMNDESMVRYMKKILKYFGFANYIQDRIPFLRIKRNRLVHEIKDEITINDRNIIKLVVDYLILFLLNWSGEVNNNEEYKFILDNFNKTDLNRRIELLSILNE